MNDRLFIIAGNVLNCLVDLFEGFVLLHNVENYTLYEDGINDTYIVMETYL